MIKTYIQQSNSQTYIGLEGDDKQEIEFEFWGYHNRGFGYRLHWNQEEFAPYFAYFHDFPRKLMPILKERELFKLLQKFDNIHQKRGNKEITDVLEKKAEYLAQKTFDSFHPAEFYRIAPRDYYNYNYLFSKDLTES